MTTQKAWLPNLVGGVSVWKLAEDLNAKNFMDGRLLVPETEGAESLPTEVRWNVDGLIPLAEAQRSHADGVARAIDDFQVTLAGVEKALAAEDSGYARYRDAFTMPTIDAVGEDQYFYDPAKERLRVKNWGASPRELAGGKEAVFGLGRLGAIFAGVAVADTAATTVAAAGAALAPAAAEVDPAIAAATARANAEKKREPEEKRGAWPWIVAVVLGILLLAVLLLALRDCNGTPGDADAGPDAGDAGDAGADAGDAQDAGDAGADAGDAGADAGDAGADAGDALGDAGTLLFDDEPDASLGLVPGQGGNVVVVPGNGGGGGGGGGGGKVYVAPGQKPPAANDAHRLHAQPGAKAWRVSQGADRIARAQRKGSNFDVWLRPGMTFEGVVVEWRDKDGNWNVH